MSKIKISPIGKYEIVPYQKRKLNALDVYFAVFGDNLTPTWDGLDVVIEEFNLGRSFQIKPLKLPSTIPDVYVV